MLESIQDHLHKSIDYLEHFEDNHQEGFYRSSNSTNYRHNNSSLLLLYYKYTMVGDTDLQHLTDQLVDDKSLKMIKHLRTITPQCAQCAVGFDNLKNYFQEFSHSFIVKWQ